MHKPLSYAALLLASQFPLQALADTDVYLTNNSPDPVQLEIRQSGSGQLQAGSQWLQHRTELGPWESAMVLSFNRYEGVKAGKSYLFETRGRDPGRQLRLAERSRHSPPGRAAGAGLRRQVHWPLRRSALHAHSATKAGATGTGGEQAQGGQL